jgi:vitellogenic carboxypeptidase-like protein
MFGLFSEHGPFSVSVNGTLVPRETAWTKPFSMLYIDNPVGVGFSRTDRPDGFVQNEDEVGRDQVGGFCSLFFDRYC